MKSVEKHYHINHFLPGKKAWEHLFFIFRHLEISIKRDKKLCTLVDFNKMTNHNFIKTLKRSKTGQKAHIWIQKTVQNCDRKWFLRNFCLALDHRVHTWDRFPKSLVFGVKSRVCGNSESVKIRAKFTSGVRSEKKPKLPTIIPHYSTLIVRTLLFLLF